MSDDELERLRAQRVAQIQSAADTEQDGQPTNLDDGEFDAFLQAHEFVLVDFWAAWCQPCVAMAPVIEDVAKKWAGKVAVAKVNTDQARATAQRHRIMSIPTVILYQNGKPVQQMVGMRPRRDFDDVLSRATGVKHQSGSTTRL